MKSGVQPGSATVPTIFRYPRMAATDRARPGPASAMPRGRAAGESVGGQWSPACFFERFPSLGHPRRVASGRAELVLRSRRGRKRLCSCVDVEPPIAARVPASRRTRHRGAEPPCARACPRIRASRASSAPATESAGTWDAPGWRRSGGTYDEPGANCCAERARRADPPNPCCLSCA